MEDKITDFFEGKIPPAEMPEFLRQVESDQEYKKLFIKMQNTNACLHFLTEEKDQEIGRSGYARFNRITRKKNLVRILLKTTSYAAVFALLFVSIRYFTDRTETKPAAMCEAYVPIGQRARLTLEDGSLVWLNAGSTLIYPSVFSDERKVTLNGEAFFEVKADVQHPFTVVTQGLCVTALGTKFNVNGYSENNQVHVSLIEGNLKLWNDSTQEIFLDPGQQALFADGFMKLEPIEHDDYFLWINGIYSFMNKPLRNIIQKMERSYNVTIQVEDLPILDYEYTGKFRQQDGIDMALRMIQHIHPFKFERTDDVYIIKK